MAIEGLVTKSEGDKVIVEYLDIARIDLSALMTRMFDKFLGPAKKPDNIISIEEAKNGQARRSCEQQYRGLSDVDCKGAEHLGRRSEEQIKEAGDLPDEARE